jgi:hypothetical protein
MHLLLLVSDFAEVAHVQRPEDGTVAHVRVEASQSLGPRPASWFSLSRLIGALRPRSTSKPPVA